MTDGLITLRADFLQLCERITQQRRVAFDTEFVSEYTYQPELCLLQFAVGDEQFAVDPYEVGDLQPWWDIMADPDVQVIVHGGQAEIRFCLTLGNCCPANLVDIQLAEGLRGRSYPLGYSALVSRVIKKTVHGKETRTDWRRRPLSPKQITYALEDVLHVQPVWDKQQRWFKRHKRMPWVIDECDRMVADLAADFERPTWHRLSGLHRLTRRELAVLEAVSHWRDTEASTKDRPLRRILRDDLLIELARRQPKSEKDILATRDMNRGEYRKNFDQIIAAVQNGLAVKDSDCPNRRPRPEQDSSSDEQMLAQLLGIALANRCAEMDVARSLVGTSADLRHLVRWHVYKEHGGDKPRLMRGWRAEVCGDLLTDVLDGRIGLRVADVNSDHPLIFERYE